MSPVAADLYDWLMLLHVLAAMVWVGGLVALTVLSFQATRSDRPDAVGRFVESLPIVGPLVLAPASVAILGLGVWLVADGGAWSFGQTWILLAFGLFGGASLVGAVFQSRAALGAQRAAEAGDDAEASRQLRRWSWGMRTILLLLVAATWDMVFKPGS
jgi:uncharacterized membrane protein